MSQDGGGRARKPQTSAFTKKEETTTQKSLPPSSNKNQISNFIILNNSYFVFLTMRRGHQTAGEHFSSLSVCVNRQIKYRKTLVLLFD
jgi:hypothetical protein